MSKKKKKSKRNEVGNGLCTIIEMILAFLAFVFFIGGTFGGSLIMGVISFFCLGVMLAVE